MLEAAQESGWTELEIVALLFGTVDLLEGDRVPEAQAMLEQMRRRLATTDRAMFDVYVDFLDGGFALLRGDLAAAEVFSNRALDVGVAAHGDNATQGWAAQQFLLANYRGQLPDLQPIVADLVEQFPLMPAWKAALATCEVNAGRPEAARAAYTAAFVGDRIPLRQSPTWYTTVAQLSEVAWGVRDTELARRLLPLVEPFSHRVGITGMGAICLGHIARHHGLVLATLERHDEAIDALAHAIARAEACGFEPWLARALAERADVLEARGGPGDDIEAKAQRERATEIAERLGIRLRLAPDD